MRSRGKNGKNHEKGGKNIMANLTTQIKYATVTSTNPFKVQFDSDATVSENNNYKKLSSYDPTIGDRVAFINDGRSILCLGKVV